jgi:autotransporter translocation and assembly factor TamB
MTRTLILIAGVGFLMAVICLGAAAALGGRDLAEHGWTMHGGTLHGVHFTVDDDRDGRTGVRWSRSANVDGGGPAETREIAWSGGQSLDIEVPADVRFTQSSGPAKLIITGPKGTVDQLRLSGSDLDFDQKPGNPQRVTITMIAPDVRHFTLEGDGDISIAGFDQDKLDLELNGDNQATVQGRARALSLDISGAGKADLGALAVEQATVQIEGSGRATVAPSQKADLEISGDGEIDLTSHPADMHSEVSGSGRIVQGAAAATSRPR